VTNRRSRVVFVVPSLGLGGAERQVVDLVNHIDGRRFDPTLFTFEKAADLADAVRQERVRLVREPRRFKLDSRPIERLSRHIRDEEVELVHCTLQVSLLVAMEAIRRSGRRVRVIDAIHSTKNRGWKEELADRLVYVPLMKRCDRIIAVCEAQRAVWVAKFPWMDSRITTVRNGIDLTRYQDDVPEATKAELRRQFGIDEGDVVLGMVAAVRPEKNHLEVLEALPPLAASGRRFRFLFVGGAVPGTGDLEGRVHARSMALGLEPHVRWTGRVNDPKAIISILDAVVLFSTTESLPMALLECLAMGKPVISSNVGGIPEIVEHESNGLLVPARDVEALEGALARILANPGFLREISSRARPSVQARFSIDRMTRETEDVLAHALGARPRRDLGALPTS
jgi:glycosyltransferase involved in cell wall biosynthesis